MKQLNKHSGTIAATLLAAVALFAGCTKVDDTLGGNLVPENQQMKVGYVQFPSDRLSPKKYIETRLFKSDSIKISNISYGYMGSELNDTLGLRTAGFFSQMITYFAVEEGYFGYKPIFDSAQINLSISSYGRDTLTEQRFGVYEILSNDYVAKQPVAAGKTERDSVFYLGFDPMDPNGDGSARPVYDPAKPLFHFTLGGKQGPSTTDVTLTPTDEGLSYVRRLMLLEGKYKGDYSIYTLDNLEKWIEEFRGLCIRPVEPVTTAGGAIYATDLTSSGLTIYGRNHNEEDPTLIQDTIGMTFFFYDSYAEHGNVSVNLIDRDYSLATAATARIDEAAAREVNADGTPNTNRPENARVYVEGLGGVVTEITFAETFFKELDAIIAKENAASGKDFRTLSFNQVRMMIYFADSDYNWKELASAPGRLLEEMDAAPERLGIYANYKSLEAISDYNYYYETNYDLTLAYGGYINRSHGCYEMDITGYVQQLWNSYTKEKQAAEAEGRAVDFDRIENRSVYIGPDAYSTFTSPFGIFQGGTTDATSPIQNNAPIRFEITYNMIR